MKAVALLSGGLDSTLAIKVILDQGIEVTAIHFLTPFNSTSRDSYSAHLAKKAMEGMGVEFKAVHLVENYFDMLRNPKHGYGKNMNPCTDCHTLMCREAKKIMEDVNASFVITGEVLGQRPMSQNKASLKYVEKESGLDGLLLRPLSAKLLSPTIPEQEGWVDREKLLALSGRTRRPQIALAEQWGVTDYTSPAGGCLLTAVEFSRKLKDVLEYSDIDLNVAELLKVGRHFRLGPQLKLIVGKNKEDNERIQKLAQIGDILLNPVEVKGPIALARGEMNEETISLASRIVARYCDGDDAEYNISCRLIPDTESRIISIDPVDENVLSEFRI